MSRQTDAYAAIESASSPAFTRDGRTLLHLRGAGLPQIWALDLDSGETRQITHHDEKIAFFRRCPVDDRIIYGIDRGGDERQQLWLVDPASPAPRPLTDDLDVIHEWGGWSPDGSQFALSANSRDPAQFDVFVQDVATGERRCVLRTSGIATSSGFRADGKRLAVIVDRGQGDQDLLLVDAQADAAGPGVQSSWPGAQSFWPGAQSFWPGAQSSGRGPQSSWPGLTRPSQPDLCGTGSPRTVLEEMAGSSPAMTNGRPAMTNGRPAMTNARPAMTVTQQPVKTTWQSVRWASDGRTLLALTDHGGSDFLKLCRIDPDSGEVTELFTAPGRDLDAYTITSDAAHLATIENDRGYAILRIDGQEVTGIPKGVISEPTFSPDGATLACVVATPTAPGALWLVQNTSARPVWQPQVAMPAAEWELVEWQGEDGTPIPGWLVLPAGPTPPEGHKAVIWVHGGPAMQLRPTFRPDIQMLVGQGLAVLLPNVRGSTGYGRRSTESDDGAKRPAAVADLAQGRHWLAAHKAIDPARIAVMGQSYGGFMVNAAITSYPDLWKAAVCYYGIADFVTMLEATGPWRRSHRAAEYADPEDPALFDRISPIHRIDQVRVPVLVAHGTRDPRVPIGESEQLVTALRERQKPVTYLTFDYAGHGFIRPDHRRMIYSAVADFLAEHL
jgi:dipeptidyl aminopeptidase/acylaminoacyl peptidase